MVGLNTMMADLHVGMAIPTVKEFLVKAKLWSPEPAVAVPV